MNETWVNIEGFNGHFQVSDLGKVRSIDRVVIEQKTGRNKSCKGRIMSIWKNHGGYNMISFRFQGIKSSKALAIMVAKAFIPNPNNLPEVNHLDGNKDNNAKSNLGWDTRLGNQLHSIQVLGKHHAGECHYKAKLTCNIVIKMRELFQTGKYSKSEIGRMFGVGKDHAINIINNKCWKTLKRA